MKKAFYFIFKVLLILEIWQYHLFLQADAQSCPCSKNKCSVGICLCLEHGATTTCNWKLGTTIPAGEGVYGDKHYLFFSQPRYWEDAKEICESYWNGKLAMPKSVEINDFLYFTSLDSNLHKNYHAIWLGFSDLDTEGTWLFVDDTTVNKAPTFGQNGLFSATVPVPPTNTSTIDNVWHFYFNKNSYKASSNSIKVFCQNIGGHMSYSMNHNEIRRMSDFVSLDEDGNHVNALHHLGIRKRGSGYETDGGDKVYLNKQWYIAKGITLPKAELLAKFQAWDYPPEPDGSFINSGGTRAAANCIALKSQNSKWIDIDCAESSYPSCEFGPYGFERWHLGGTKFSEPNNAGGDQDCGTMRYDIDEIGRTAYSGSLREFWDDWNCASQLPFACETTFPPDCDTYVPPMTDSCLLSVWENSAGCTILGSGSPTNLPSDRLNVLKSKNLHQVYWYFTKISKVAQSPTLNKNNQKICYGMEFPDGCKTYRSQRHTLQCVSSMWRMAECIDEGINSPKKMTPATFNSFAAMDLRNMLVNFKVYSKSAFDLGPQGQGACFGLNFSTGCSSYFGPHSLDCLRGVWEEIGCTVNGNLEPGKRSARALADLKTLHLRELLRQFRQTSTALITYGGVNNRLNCYGMQNCAKFDGPHTEDCLTEAWLKVGCTTKGTMYPSGITSAQRSSEWGSRNIVEVVRHMKATRISADKGGILGALDCYGTKPSRCRKTTSPFSIQCLNYVWLGVGCIRAGKNYPSSLTSSRRDKLWSGSLRNMVASMNASYRLSNGFQQHQLNCYGIAFPPHCTSFHETHEVACLVSMFIAVGCILEGSKHPIGITESEKNFLNTKDINGVKAYYKKIRDDTSRSSTAQRHCYGIEFQRGCTSYTGTHSATCLQSMFTQAGCISQGRLYPKKALTTSQTLREVEADMKKIRSKASARNKTGQFDCYGLFFARACSSYEGPHSVTCLNSVWGDQGCTLEGTKAPRKLTTRERQSLNSKNQRQLIAHMKKISDNAIGGNKVAQLQCFGQQLPPGCSKYVGPHSNQCYREMWKSVGCAITGEAYPDKLTGGKKAAIDALNIKDLKIYMLRYKTNALAFNKRAQLDCYGIEFPPKCNSFEGPHSLDCLKSIWDQSGCFMSGRGYPGKLTNAEINTLSTKTLIKVKTDMDAKNVSAHGGNKVSQLDCFGLEFPNGCTKFGGPFTIRCLESIWVSAGCLIAGRKSPSNLTNIERSRFDRKSIIQVEAEFKAKSRDALSGNPTAQVDCYGYPYPRHCRSNTQPLSMECVRSAWLSVGCAKEGYGHPDNISTIELGKYTTSTVSAALNLMRALKRRADTEVTARLKCYGLKAFPDGCTTYSGPHGIKCLTKMWYQVGCGFNGKKFPEKLGLNEIKILRYLNLGELRKSMKDTNTKALGGVKQSQLDCFGIIFPLGCDRFEPPHTLPCLNNAWLAVGCSAAGKDYPGTISRQERAIYNTMNLTEVLLRMGKIHQDAVHLLPAAQSSCWGRRIPRECISFVGPHSLACLEKLWSDAGCEPGGAKRPKHLLPSALAALQKLDIGKIEKQMSNLREKAGSSDIQAQQDCFGFSIPSSCYGDQKPYTVYCLQALWREAGCLPEGLHDPGRLSNIRLTVLQHMSLSALMSQMADEYNSAILPSAEGQLNCFGTVLPKSCKKHTPPLSMACYISLWLKAGCDVKGEKYPTKLSNTEIATLDSFNVDEAQEYMNNTRKKALTGDTQSQKDCFGLAFPNGCHRFVGAFTKDCLKSLWTSSGCKDDGGYHPSKLTDKQLKGINAMNLTEVKQHYKDIYDKAKSGRMTSQRACYGVVFPVGCNSFSGPYSKQCLMNVWKQVGCLPEGYTNPYNISKPRNATLQSLSFIDLVKDFAGISAKSRRGDAQALLNCRGTHLPEGCKSETGPHNLICLRNLWHGVGCAKEGRRYPDDLSAPERINFSRIHINMVRARMKKDYDDAVKGDQSAQLDCFGIAIPASCRTYAAPHSVACYNEIWKAVGCTFKGLDTPSKLSTERKAVLDGYDLNHVRSTMQETYNKAFGGYTESQLGCFGYSFPGTCVSMNGPHSLFCLQGLWKMVGCSVEGKGYPASFSETKNLRTSNLTHVLTTMQTIRSNAVPANPDAQVECFGAKTSDLPKDCPHFDGPHTLICLVSLWKAAGCSDGGFKHPSNISTIENMTLHTLNIKQIKTNFKHLHKLAHQGESQAQLYCFGFNYPAGCSSGKGPFTYDCLNTIWEKVGCTQEGDAAPEKLSPSELKALNTMTIQHVEEHFKDLEMKTRVGDVTAQKECYGMKGAADVSWLGFNQPIFTVILDSVKGVQFDKFAYYVYSAAFNVILIKNHDKAFYRRCHSYTPPHTRSCLADLFLHEANCLSEGTLNPNTLSSTMLNEVYGDKNQRELAVFMKKLHNNPEGPIEQMGCYGSSFPANCTSYNGRHTVECLESIWMQIGCTKYGWRNPINRTMIELDPIRNLNLHEVRVLFNRSFKAVLSGSVQDKVDCFGFRSCPDYYGPLAVECLAEIWERVGCTERGCRFPYRLSDNEIDKFWDSFNLNKVSQMMTTTRIDAGKHSALPALDCFGEFPKNCTHFDGPLHVDCLAAIWTGIGCTKDGSGYPYKIPRARRLIIWRNDNLRNVMVAMTTTPLGTAMQGNKLDQLKCFGKYYPVACTSFEGPHTLQCIQAMWKRAGCSGDGTDYPVKYSVPTNTTYQQLNLTEIHLHVKKLHDAAHPPDKKKQMKCFGLIFPPGCSTFEPPHSLECFKSIRSRVGCVNDKFHFVSNLSAYEQNMLKYSTIGEIEKHVTYMKKRAEAYQRKAQFSCYHMLYPKICKTPGGPHPLKCLQEMWENVGCVKEGKLYFDKTSYDQFSRKSLDHIRRYVHGIKQRALSGHLGAQMNCFGLNFPKGCKTYHGPHSALCKKTIHKSGGCGNEEFHYSVDQIPRASTSLMDSGGPAYLTLRQMQADVKSAWERSLKSDKGAQINCYGTKLSKICTKYLPPASIECLEQVWEDVGCLEEGHLYPGKVRPGFLKHMNLGHIKNYMRHIQKTSQQSNRKSQLDCYGITFPKECKSYYPPHSLECYVDARIDSGCSSLEHYRMDKLRSEENLTITTLNLREMLDKLYNLKCLAEAGDDMARSDCYRLEFPDGCKTFPGPHTVKCLQSLWETDGCSKNGKKYPTFETKHIFKKKSLGELKRDIYRLVKLADIGVTDAQLECYGFTFPGGCGKFHGPHPEMCLQGVFRDAGCINEGYANPTNTSYKQRGLVDSFNLEELLKHMNRIKDNVKLGDGYAQLDCYGIRFPDGCKSYYGPHTVDCLNGARRLAGLESDPGHLTPSRNKTLNSMNIRELIAHMKSISEHDIVMELYDAGSVCVRFEPPLTLDCLNEIWLDDALCLEEGSGFPGGTNSTDRIKQYEGKNKLSVESEMVKIREAAYDGDKQAQMECFGLELLKNCTTYFPPLPLGCLTAIWTLDVGCLEEGEGYPAKLNVTSLTAQWGGKNIREVKQGMQNVKDKALSPDEDYQEQCYGAGVPMWMYVLTTTAVKFIMITLGVICLIFMSYMAFRLLMNCHARTPAEGAEPPVKRVFDDVQQPTRASEQFNPRPRPSSNQNVSRMTRRESKPDSYSSAGNFYSCPSSVSSYGTFQSL